MADMAGQALELRGRLGLEEDWIGRWDSLSHGERKRAQIAVALWRRPSVLAIDEPTNHLDREARRMLAEALRRYDGVLRRRDRTRDDRRSIWARTTTLASSATWRGCRAKTGKPDAC